MRMICYLSSKHNFATQDYELKSRTLEDLVNQKVQEAEAKKKGIAVGELLEQEVDAKVAEPTQAEVMAACRKPERYPASAL